MKQPRQPPQRDPVAARRVPIREPDRGERPPCHRTAVQNMPIPRTWAAPRVVDRVAGTTSSLRGLECF